MTSVRDFFQTLANNHLDSEWVNARIDLLMCTAALSMDGEIISQEISQITKVRGALLEFSNPYLLNKKKPVNSRKISIYWELRLAINQWPGGVSGCQRASLYRIWCTYQRCAGTFLPHRRELLRLWWKSPHTEYCEPGIFSASSLWKVCTVPGLCSPFHYFPFPFLWMTFLSWIFPHRCKPVNDEVLDSYSVWPELNLRWVKYRPYCVLSASSKAVWFPLLTPLTIFLVYKPLSSSSWSPCYCIVCRLLLSE